MAANWRGGAGEGMWCRVSNHKAGCGVPIFSLVRPSEHCFS